MRKNILKLFPMFIFLSFLLGCTKEDIKPERDLLILGEWKLVKIEERSFGAAPGPWQTLTWQSCFTDNLRIFRNDKSYETNEGATKCDLQDLQFIETGNWELDIAKTKLFIHLKSGPNKDWTLDWDIANLDENVMELTKNGWDLEQRPNQARFTFEKH